MRWILAFVMGLTLAGAAWGQQPDDKHLDKAHVAEQFGIPIRTLDDPEKDGRERDTLRAQQGATEAAYIQATLSALQFAAGIVTLILLKLTFDATRASAKAAGDSAFAASRSARQAEQGNRIAEKNNRETQRLIRTQHIDSSRPWLVASEFQLMKDDGIWVFSCALGNIGRTPATNIHAYACFDHSSSTNIDIGHFNKSAASMILLPYKEPFNRVIVPEQTTTFVAFHEVAPPEPTHPSDFVRVVYCIQYRLHGAREQFFTCGIVYTELGQPLYVPANHDDKQHRVETFPIVISVENLRVG